MQLFTVTENIENGMEEFMKRNIALLLVLLLLVFVGIFAFTACDDEEPEPDDFEKYGLQRYVVDYDFVRVSLIRKWDEEREMYSEVPLSEGQRELMEDGTYLLYYRDGEETGPWNEALLAVNHAIRNTGLKVRFERDRTVFDGNFGSIPSEPAWPVSHRHVDVRLHPEEGVETNIVNNIYNISSLKYNPLYDDTDAVVQFKFVDIPTENGKYEVTLSFYGMSNREYIY